MSKRFRRDFETFTGIPSFCVDTSAESALTRLNRYSQNYAPSRISKEPVLGQRKAIARLAHPMLGLGRNLRPRIFLPILSVLVIALRKSSFRNTEATPNCKFLGQRQFTLNISSLKKLKLRRQKKSSATGSRILVKMRELQHNKFVSKIGNLTIVPGELNIGASNNPFVKKKVLTKDSAIKITQELAQLPAFQVQTG